MLKMNKKDGNNEKEKQTQREDISYHEIFISTSTCAMIYATDCVMKHNFTVFMFSRIFAEFLQNTDL